MRAHGVTDFPDPTIGSNGLPTLTINAGDVDPQSPAFRAARQVCKQDLPNLGSQTPAERATATAAALRYATCMRSEGVPDFPDPNGQGLIQAGNVDASSPQFQKAETACNSLDNGFAQQLGATSASPAPRSAQTGS